jgi:hypothetical protein
VPLAFGMLAKGFDAKGLLPTLGAEKLKPLPCDASRLLLLLLDSEAASAPKTSPEPTSPNVCCGWVENGLVFALGGNRRWGVPPRPNRPRGVAILNNSLANEPKLRRARRALQQMHDAE